MLFFAPAEELHGGNMFSKMSSNYSIIQPYVEMIDSDFIQLMNKNSNNVSMYTNPNNILINGQRIQIDKGSNDTKTNIKKLLSADNTEAYL